MSARQCDPVVLDLAFTGADDAQVNSLGRSASTQRLQNPELWQSDLCRWLETLRENRVDPTVPELTACEEISLGLQFTGDQEIAELNGRWRGLPQPTDVLSFAALESEMPLQQTTTLELGDIVVSVPTAARQALEQGHSLERELQWLVSHGLLHLLGWDHPDEPTLNAMIACQERLLAMAGNVQSHGEINCERADEITAEP
ncbi:MAG: rRNA maturation RNase YbeY [Synechococcus sp.]|jgi:probable rRNA maturation factor|uniref:rRNA maturation RNase YbeY n=1 Tax=unclassified Synechococcus TaxID=2626047 RepID=UPI0001525604|nr:MULTISPECIES: rRNA maturation RNase YbeY [unclassified Synechococcus]MCT0250216.1 rRNA maturation RNase YbeY [Synechococcus sp. CS-197]QNI68937.1 endoribonuclease YqfG [Synechococcus sp. BMK-MC-1]CAK24753.1 Predicted metal-dependent hydrolase [Synechococcus sp. WH 7803]